MDLCMCALQITSNLGSPWASGSGSNPRPFSKRKLAGCGSSCRLHRCSCLVSGWQQFPLSAAVSPQHCRMQSYGIKASPQRRTFAIQPMLPRNFGTTRIGQGGLSLTRFQEAPPLGVSLQLLLRFLVRGVGKFALRRCITYFVQLDFLCN